MSETLQPGAVPDYGSLDADAAEFLRQTNATPWDYRNTPIQELRDGLSIPVRVYTPSSDQTPLPICVYYHGGGFVFNDDLEVFDHTAGSLASGGSCIVVSVNYRLAPEHPFPAAVNDCYAALTWVAENAASFGGDASRLAVAGDSAGGNLAAGCALLARDRQGPELRLQLLHYPVVDAPDPERPSFRKYGKGATRVL
ncbi:hypothetical protein WJX72_002801 [[Myrmecia] bisecta]|uniref:Alpha/beta hydrolase fold-3 domain-containing protein n=1 Tax=[Myrmecia] bisecta TaxID=41462 RepID=A0AAW1R577_9CHLO